MPKILIVEDEASIARFLKLELEHEGYAVECVGDGRDGLERAKTGDFDLIILDVMLPGFNGFEVLRRLRQTHATPVVILTARDQVMDKVAGLDVGADDYITKPFAIEELLARIRSILKRRNEPAATGKTIKIGKLEIGLDEHEVSYDGVSVVLTKKEYDLLVYLAQNKNIALSRDVLLSDIWGYDFGDVRTIDTHVKNLRNNLGPYRGKVVTLRGIGYKFEA